MNKVSKAHIEAAHRPKNTMHLYGGPEASLRAYQHHHPDAAIYTVTYRGRTVWMTSKQRAIWSEVQHYWRRGKRDTLQRIASAVGCSRATVSRFLRRLDLWRFIDLATLRGRGGGTYIFTRVDPYNEKPQKWTSSKRQRIRDAVARQIRRANRLSLEPMLVWHYLQLGRRPTRPPYWETAEQMGYQTGSTGATFSRPK
jgi:hypothetical protein